jgi:hypothetical protein
MEAIDKSLISCILENIFQPNDTFLCHLADATPYIIYSENDINNLLKPASSPQALNILSDFSGIIHQMPKSKRFEMDDNLLWEEYSILFKKVVLAQDKSDGLKVGKSIPEDMQDKYAKYKEIREKVLSKLTEYQENFRYNKSDDTWKKINMPLMLSEIDVLNKEWVSEGFKIEIEKNINSKVHENTLTFSSLWALWTGKYCEFLSLNSDLKGAGSDFATFYTPFQNLLKIDTWQKAAFNHETIKNVLSSNPFLNQQKEIENYANDVEAYSFEYQRLNIERSWFVPQIFEARFWKMSANFSNEIVSDGKLSGTISSYIQEVIFIKNFSKEIRKNLIEEGLEWLGGLVYNKIYKEMPKDSNFYLVAMDCKRVPLSPNPDNSLEWDLNK